ncbi:putative bifunctional diguanylate cyclase/phosphodiesterase [Marinobacter salicampi]|uniref:putative bifunctional diguanylate cyclase/phosphodiesterase n=1 Tax=Marinobacter salicampi TaxID=435907 RepID=UPI0014075960|nr:GGDEF domain-containing protein [Marinobacter salicampi]
MARILLLLSHEGNRRVLAEALPQHTLVRWQEGMTPGPDIDLVIVDFNRLRSSRATLRTLRQSRDPELVPVLLMLRENQLGHTRNVLGNEVDDVVFTPVLTAELRARINNLERLQELSRHQHQRFLLSETQRVRMDRAYRILAASNEAAIRSSTEDDLLDRVLTHIVGPEGYRLAWVGMAHQNTPGQIDVLAVHEADSARGNNLDALVVNEEQVAASPAQSAIAERLPVISGPAELARDGQLAERGIRTALALPLFFDGSTTLGVMVIYSTISEAFHTDEVALLQKLADNAAHGISSLRMRDKLEEQRALAQRRAYRDALTGLPNRQYIKEELAKLDSEAERHERYAALLFVDLDGFKRINDSLGHVVGDRLLWLVAERLRQLAREEDFVARLGGDEFVFLIHGETIEAGTGSRLAGPMEELARAASQLAERVVECMREPFLDGSHEHRLGASVGIALFPADTTAATKLINWADMAMYEAKSRGGDQFQFYSAMLTTIQRERLALENELHEAVDRKELITFYQPILNLQTGEVEAVEALMRWPRMDGSLRTPEQFLKVLEETGLIARAGELVFREACRALMECRTVQPDLRLALNLSINQLWQPHILEQIQDITRAEGMPADALVIEITEDSMLRDACKMESMLARLCASGYDVAIDDFGTGYSSLSRLRDMPVAMLKLDKSFLKNVEGQGTSNELVRTIGQMAEALNMRLVAEGIETEAQWRVVRDYNYSFGQGFFFAKPMPVAELKTFLADQKAMGYPWGARYSKPCRPVVGNY